MSQEEAQGPAVRGGVAVGAIKMLRPHQWVKNVFVLAPLFFSRSYLEPALALRAGVAALLFSLTAGAVYVVNDMIDVEKDRAHPTKRRRPIASGVVPMGLAGVIAALLVVATQGAAWWLDARLGGVLLGYLVMNLAYSVWLKHVAYLDVTIIATGFVLRVLAGAFGIDVFISEWLVACTFLLTLYLGLGKRLHELKLVEGGRSKLARPALARYDVKRLNFGALFVSGLTIATYTIYTLTASLPGQPLRAQQTPFSSPLLFVTIPFAVFGITRFYMLLSSDELESPTELILRDWPFLVNLVAWGVLMLGIALWGAEVMV